MSLHKLRCIADELYSQGLCGTAAEMKRCLDELAALADGGEAAAWMDHMGGVITAAMKAADPGRPYNTPLFTHHAGAVQERMRGAIEEAINCIDLIAIHPPVLDQARRVLHRALNPGGSRE